MTSFVQRRAGASPTGYDPAPTSFNLYTDHETAIKHAIEDHNSSAHGSVDAEGRLCDDLNDEMQTGPAGVAPATKNRRGNSHSGATTAAKKARAALLDRETGSPVSGAHHVHASGQASRR
ncbi:hypothetical protein GCM10022409_31410 [Hymenobacter glaciei]|uniref:DUF1059 domain-containing protein n=1 Tax=Hymenobacter glaciei TaxID=877209 RepID=A0ABP7UGV7_9BACT